MNLQRSVGVTKAEVKALNGNSPPEIGTGMVVNRKVEAGNGMIM